MPGEKEQEILGAQSVGLLIIGHGTRSRSGRDEFQKMVEDVRPLIPDITVRAGLLEGGPPTIESGWQELIDAGVKKMVVSPLLLFAAGHAKEDIPLILRHLARQSPLVQIRAVPPLGCDPALVNLSVKRYHQAITGDNRPETPIPAPDAAAVCRTWGSRCRRHGPGSAIRQAGRGRRKS